MSTLGNPLTPTVAIWIQL